MGLFPLVFKKCSSLSTSSKHLAAHREHAFEATGNEAPCWVWVLCATFRSDGSEYFPISYSGSLCSCAIWYYPSGNRSFSMSANRTVFFFSRAPCLFFSLITFINRTFVNAQVWMSTVWVMPLLDVILLRWPQWLERTEKYTKTYTV